jgi:hypothetical protein
VVHPDGGRVPVSTENLLLRECILKNTDFVEGIVIYAGHETKALLNNGGPRYKVYFDKDKNCISNLMYQIIEFRSIFFHNMHDDVVSAVSSRKIHEQRCEVVRRDTVGSVRNRCVRLPILVVRVHGSAGDTVSTDTTGASLREYADLFHLHHNIPSDDTVESIRDY